MSATSAALCSRKTSCTSCFFARCTSRRECLTTDVVAVTSHVSFERRVTACEPTELTCTTWESWCRCISAIGRVNTCPDSVATTTRSVIANPAVDHTWVRAPHRRVSGRSVGRSVSTDPEAIRRNDLRSNWVRTYVSRKETTRVDNNTSHGVPTTRRITKPTGRRPKTEASSTIIRCRSAIDRS